MASRQGYTVETLRSCIHTFRTVDLQQVLKLTDMSKAGRKHDLQRRILNYIDSGANDARMIAVREEIFNIHIRNLGQSSPSKFETQNARMETRTRGTTQVSNLNNKMAATLPPVAALSHSMYHRVNGVPSQLNNIATVRILDGPVLRLQRYPQIDMVMSPYLSLSPLASAEPLCPVHLMLPPTGEVAPMVIRQFYDCQLSFHLSNRQVDGINAKRTMRDGQPDFGTQIILRFFQLDPNLFSGSAMPFSQPALDDSLPVHLNILVNGKPVSLPTVLPTNKPGMDGRRPPRAINITHQVRLVTNATNNIRIYWNFLGQFYATFVTIMDKITPEKLTKDLIRSSTKPPEFTKAIIRQKLGGGAEDDDLVMATSLPVSLICPLGMCRISVPARGTHCSHIQCFDAFSYLSMNQRKPTWRCPVCDTPTDCSSLYVDSMLQLILTSAATTNLKEIFFNPDGTWTSAEGPKSSANQSTDPSNNSPHKPSQRCRSPDDLVIVSLENESPTSRQGSGHQRTNNPPIMSQNLSDDDSNASGPAVTVGSTMIDLTETTDEEDANNVVEVISNNSPSIAVTSPTSSLTYRDTGTPVASLSSDNCAMQTMSNKSLPNHRNRRNENDTAYQSTHRPKNKSAEKSSNDVSKSKENDESNRRLRRRTRAIVDYSQFDIYLDSEDDDLCQTSAAREKEKTTFSNVNECSPEEAEVIEDHGDVDDTELNDRRKSGARRRQFKRHRREKITPKDSSSRNRSSGVIEVSDSSSPSDLDNVPLSVRFNSRTSKATSKSASTRHREEDSSSISSLSSDSSPTSSISTQVRRSRATMGYPIVQLEPLPLESISSAFINQSESTSTFLSNNQSSSSSSKHNSPEKPVVASMKRKFPDDQPSAPISAPPLPQKQSRITNFFRNNMDVDPPVSSPLDSRSSLQPCSPAVPVPDPSGSTTARERVPSGSSSYSFITQNPTLAKYGIPNSSSLFDHPASSSEPPLFPQATVQFQRPPFALLSPPSHVDFTTCLRTMVSAPSTQPNPFAHSTSTHWPSNPPTTSAPVIRLPTPGFIQSNHPTSTTSSVFGAGFNFTTSVTSSFLDNSLLSSFPQASELPQMNGTSGSNSFLNNQDFNYVLSSLMNQQQQRRNL